MLEIGKFRSSRKLFLLNLFVLAAFEFFAPKSLVGIELKQELGVGFESGFEFYHDQIYTQVGTSSGYTSQATGDLKFTGFELGPSFSWDIGIPNSLSIGIRATTLILGPSFPFNFFPRLNARLMYEFNDWLSTSIEFPYTTGIGVKLFRSFYIFFGTDAPIAPKPDFVLSTVVLYQFQL